MQKITTFEEAREFFGISSAVSSSTALKKELILLRESKWFFDRSVEELEQAEKAMSILVDTYHEWVRIEEDEENKKKDLLLKIAQLYEKLA